MPTLEEALTLGWQEHQAGNSRRAEQIYRQVLPHHSTNPRIWFLLGLACQAQQRPEEAAAYIQQALELNPHEAEGYFYLGNAYLQQGKLNEAGSAYQKCVLALPDHAEARANLGFVLSGLGRAEEAEVHFRHTLRLKPELPELHLNLGNALRDQRRFEEAAHCYREAVRIKPDFARAHVNLGIVLGALGQIDLAEAALRKALEIDPRFADAYNSLGATLNMAGRTQEALAYYRRALALEPELPEAHANLALGHLMLGDFEAGWPEYEWRWRCKELKPLTALPQPLWDGTPLCGRTILLREEQGLGDTLQFIRYARLVKQRGGRVLFHCQRGLGQFLTGCPGLDGIVEWDMPLPPFDVQAPLLSLPMLLKTTLETVPAEVPYLFADPLLVAYWRRELEPLSGLRVGIVWQGHAGHPGQHRSLALAQLEPLARLKGVTLVSLQRGDGLDQLDAVRDRWPMHAPGSIMSQMPGAFMEVAALMRNLDLVITIDTSIAHLAGALGTPVWLMLSAASDWRWLRERVDSPWYPTMRLFRQARLNEWGEVVERLTSSLRSLVDAAVPGL
jgi:tetratricopeptide (TPR) repeat protein